ncbi:c-type cytochrome [Diaphorobacter caeni]|uniref:c-type cytochrome n=1 Tax=Diaphorobacter caeni TaxID=2784387 RepID=UPI001E47C692|nr:c-type cytochrome [Diaphorobacter caeni]
MKMKMTSLRMKSRRPLALVTDLAATLSTSLLMMHAAHAFEVVKPQVDAGALPASARTWDEPNPLRGNKDAAVIGRSAFNQACAQCHGADANGSRSPAPDLRRMGIGCRRIQDEALRQRCMGDADAFFMKSVRQGKQKFGIVHMPPWEGVLTPEVAWSIRSFVETAPK